MSGAAPGPSGVGEAWRREVADVVELLRTEVERGLTSLEVSARLECYGSNRLDDAVSVPSWRKFLTQFVDPLILLLLAAVVVSFSAWLVEGRHGFPFDVVVILWINLLTDTALALAVGVDPPPERCHAPPTTTNRRPDDARADPCRFSGPSAQRVRTLSDSRSPCRGTTAGQSSRSWMWCASRSILLAMDHENAARFAIGRAHPVEELVCVGMHTEPCDGWVFRPFLVAPSCGQL